MRMLGIGLSPGFAWWAFVPFIRHKIAASLRYATVKVTRTTTTPRTAATGQGKALASDRCAHVVSRGSPYEGISCASLKKCPVNPVTADGVVLLLLMIMVGVECWVLCCGHGGCL
jgi:hypothetical protein